MTASRSELKSPLRLGWEFFKIGCVSFGGFMAVISVVEDVFARRLGWIKHEDMLDGVSLANILPGPQAVNTTAYVGYACGGPLGALASVIGIVTPTFIMVTVLTFLYFGVAQDMTMLDGFFVGLIPAVAAVILSVVLRMWSKCVREPLTWVIAVGAAVLLLLSPASIKLWVNLGVLAGAAFAGMARLQPDDAPLPPDAPMPTARLVAMVGLPLALAGLYLAAPPLDPDGIAQIGLTFAGLSVLLFGGGYVFIPLIMDAVVTNAGWLTAAQFNDGIAFSQMTPGPIVICAAFIGQKVAMDHFGPLWGIVGGLVATVAIFGPPAILMIAASQIFDHIKANRRAQGALRGIRAAVVGMIAAAVVIILKISLPQDQAPLSEYVSVMLPSLLIMGASFVALVRFKMSLAVVIPLAGVLGWFVF